MSLSFDAASAVSVTLSNGNLTVTATNATTSKGAKALSAQSAGKLYFEITLNTKSTGGWGSDTGCGVATNSSTYANVGNNATTGTLVFYGTGNIWSNGSSSGLSLGARSAGDVIGCAFDLTNHKAWFRVNGGNWNGQVIGSQDPANNIGGVTVTSSAAVEPFVTFNIENSVITANFGFTSFSGTVPSGFGPWDPSATITLTESLYSSTNTFGSSSINVKQTLTATTYINSNSFGSDSLGSNKTLTTTRYINSNSFGSSNIIVKTELTTTVYANNNSFGSSTLNVGTIPNLSLSASIYSSSNNFYRPFLALGSEVIVRTKLPGRNIVQRRRDGIRQVDIQTLPADGNRVFRFY